MRRSQLLPFLPDLSPIHLLVLLLLPCHGCKDDGPVPPVTSLLRLSAEDASCTEAWLRVQLDASAQPRTVLLKRDTVPVFNQTIVSSDTTIVDEGLLPRRTYSYQAFRLSNGGAVEQTPAVQLTTMDTTSHNFTWQIDTLGDGNSSILYDVAIINDSLAYAVGEMYLRDSTGQFDPQAYNMARWNGERWELMRIQFFTFCGQPSTGSYPAKAIFAFDPQDVWIGMDGSQVVRWNGQSQSVPMCIPVAVNKLWGENDNSVYAVGYGGGIAHYNGSTWQRVESGTTLHLYDILGVRETGANQEVCVIGGRYLQGPEHAILRLNGTSVVELSSSGIPSTLYCMWFHPQRKYYVAGSGLFRKNVIGSSSPWTDLGQTNYFLSSIRGNGLNDVMACGAFGEVVHYNGMTWKSYRTVTGLVNGRYSSIAVKGDRVVAVGFDLPNAIVLRGQHSR